MDIPVFDNIYSFTEYDARGNTVSTNIKMIRPIKDFYLFDIGDNNTLGIQVRSASGSNVDLLYTTISHAFVRDDMTYEEFVGDDDEDNSIVRFGRGTKYNAVSLRRIIFGGPETKPVIFAVPLKHVSEVSSLSPTKSVKRDPKMYVADYNYPPHPTIIESKNLQYMLTEIEADGKISAHIMKIDILDNEIYPPTRRVTAYIAQGNKLKIDVLNLDDKSKTFCIVLNLMNRENFPISDIIVEPKTLKTLKTLTADPNSRYMIQQKSSDVGDTGRFYFDACDRPPPSKSHDTRPLAPPKSTDDFYTELSKLRINKESIIKNLLQKGQISTKDSAILANI